MVTITCDKTGVEFEAASKRQKNHPKVSNLLNWAANKGNPGVYGVALSQLAACKAEGMADINAIIKRVEDTVIEFNQVASEAEWHRIQLKKEQERQKRARYQERQEINNLLYGGGYRWVNYGFADEEEADAFYGMINSPLVGVKDWHLFSSDNREVSIRQAMQEMMDNGNIQAKIWIEEHSK